MKLLQHQIKFAKGYSGPKLIVHEGGTGKTICACVWLHDGRDNDALVVCPKRVVQKWKDTLTVWQTKATVVQMDSEFKKLPIKKWSAIVIDEIDEFASPLFTKDRSQRTTALYSLIKAYPDVPLLGLTATPVRSTPWNLHTLLCFTGHYIDWKVWREQYFSLESRPYLQYKAWLKKKGWQEAINVPLKKYADIVLLKDCVDELPPVTERIIPVKVDPFKSTELEPTARFVDCHRNEQKHKPKEILTIGKEYRKVLVVAYYVEQVEALAKELSKDRQTFMVHGGVKNQEQVLADAAKSDECFLVVQASLGVGWDGDTFSCVVFTSMSYKVRDFVQLKYRVRRIHNLHPVEYVYLIAGRCDKAVKKTIDLGKDFVPSEWHE